MANSPGQASEAEHRRGFVWGTSQRSVRRCSGRTGPDAGLVIRAPRCPVRPRLSVHLASMTKSIGNEPPARWTGSLKCCLTGRRRTTAHNRSVMLLNARNRWISRPCRFPPVLGPMDDHLLVEGTHQSAL